MQLNSKGRPVDEVIAELADKRRSDARWQDGRTFGMVYDGGPSVHEVAERAARLYLHENALNPLRFPSLREMEVEVVGDTAELLNASPGAGGCMTSGGTESIIMAVYAAREREVSFPLPASRQGRIILLRKFRISLTSSC